MFSDNDTIVLAKLKRGNLYYYNGNFYYPFLSLTQRDKNLISVHVNKFKKKKKKRERIKI